MTYSYKYPHPAVTADCVVFGLVGGDLKIILIKRKFNPYMGDWALPGGFIQMDEDIDSAARRELQEETGISELYLEQLACFGKPERDPRERVITIAYFAIVNLSDYSVKAGSDADEASWFKVAEPPKLAFDHEQILKAGLERLQNKVRYRPLAFEFLPEEFTLGRLQQIYETILYRKLDKRNFRKKMIRFGLLTPLDKYETDMSGRTGRMFRFDRKKFDDMAVNGFEFAI